MTARTTSPSARRCSSASERRRPPSWCSTTSSGPTQPSLSALLFALRRLAAEPVLVVATVRTGELPEALAKVAQGRLGTVLRPAPLDAAEVQRLAEALGLALPARAAQRLCRHTGGIPLYARALLDELPPERWHDPEAELPAPRPYAAIIARRLDACSAGARGLVEAVAVLGPCSLAEAASFASVAGLGVAAEPFDALEEAVDAGLLRWDGQRGLRFGHPLLGASVLAGLGAGRRARAHRAAAELADDDATALRHRAAAAAAARTQSWPPTSRPSPSARPCGGRRRRRR